VRRGSGSREWAEACQGIRLEEGAVSAGKEGKRRKEGENEPVLARARGMHWSSSATAESPSSCPQTGYAALHTRLHPRRRRIETPSPSAREPRQRRLRGRRLTRSETRENRPESWSSPKAMTELRSLPPLSSILHLTTRRGGPGDRGGFEMDE
jgi:hypothetical protein